MRKQNERHEMPSLKRDKHSWLRTAIAEAGKEQKDVAKAWGVTPGVVSRFIKSGEPRINPHRMRVLCTMLEMDANELMARLEGGTPPRAGAIARAVAARETPAAPLAPASAPGGILGAVKELEDAAARAQALLPEGLKVVFSIEKE